jgi:hypothetical protein
MQALIDRDGYWLGRARGALLPDIFRGSVQVVMSCFKAVSPPGRLLPVWFPCFCRGFRGHFPVLPRM